MSRISPTAYIKSRQDEITQMIRLYRVFRTPLRKLRSLPNPGVARHWWNTKTRCVNYRLHVLSMQETVKYLEKFALAIPMEAMKSEDSTEGTRTFTAELTRGEYKLQLTLTAVPVTIDENPEANCRKVIVGQDTHTYTTHRYAIVCD